MEQKEQRVVITLNANSINDLLIQGWKVISVTAGHVTTQYNNFDVYHGRFCFVLERKIQE